MQFEKQWANFVAKCVGYCLLVKLASVQEK